MKPSEAGPRGPVRDRRACRKASAVLLVSVGALVIASCAHTGTGSGLDGRRVAADGLVPDRVLVRGNRAVLYLGDGVTRSAFEARWRGRGLDEGGVRFRVADLAPLAELPRWTASESQRNVQARVVEAGAFAQLAQRVVDTLTPPQPGGAALLSVAGREYLLLREADGAVRWERRESAADDAAVGRFLNAVTFVEEAVRELERASAERPGELGPLLFTLGEPGEDSRFVLFDQSRRLCVLLRPGGPPAVRREGGSTEPTVRMAEALTLEGHVVALLKNPVSSLARLVNNLIQTGATLATLRTDDGGPVPPVADVPPMDPAAFERHLDTLTGTRRTRGSVRVLIDGPGYFPVLEERIEEARESIDIRVNIFDTDDVAVGIAERLRRRSREVRVRVMFDEMSTLVAGSFPPNTPMVPGFVMPATIEACLRRDSRVQVRPHFNPWLTADHGKVLLFDRRFAHLGGMNIGREYRYEWHDMMVELEGPVVGVLAEGFARAWGHAGPLGDLAYLGAAAGASRRHAGEAERADFADLRVLSTRTGGPQIYAALLEALRRARREILIENPYLYEDSVTNALIQARRRGVDVRVVLPSDSDQGLGNQSNMVTANALLASGVRVFVYPGMTHVKAAIVDGWAMLGSANFNKLSLRRNLETNVATSDPRVVERLRRELFEVDLAVSREVDQPVRTTRSDDLAEWVMSQF
jgi:cardiolipin synthase